MPIRKHNNMMEQGHIKLEGAQIYTIWRETNRTLDNYAALVRENKCLDEASNFARWLRFSGILRMIIDNPQPQPLATDGVGLATKAARLVAAIGEAYSKWGRAVPKYQQSDIDEIRGQLASIQSKLAA